MLRGGDFATLADFKAGSASNFLGSTQVALADMNADGKADLVVSGLYSNGPRVFGFTGTSLQPGTTPVKAFNGFTLTGSTWSSGLFLSAGDVTADGYADLVLGTGTGRNAKVVVFTGKVLVQSNKRTQAANFTPAGSSSTTGVRMAVRDIDGDGKQDIVTASGELVSAFKGGSLPTSGKPPLLFSFDPDTSVTGGVWVG